MQRRSALKVELTEDGLGAERPQLFIERLAGQVRLCSLSLVLCEHRQIIVFVCQTYSKACGSREVMADLGCSEDREMISGRFVNYGTRPLTITNSLTKTFRSPALAELIPFKACAKDALRLASPRRLRCTVDRCSSPFPSILKGTIAWPSASLCSFTRAAAKSPSERVAAGTCNLVLQSLHCVNRNSVRNEPQQVLPYHVHEPALGSGNRSPRWTAEPSADHGQGLFLLSAVNAPPSCSFSVLHTVVRRLCSGKLEKAAQPQAS